MILVYKNYKKNDSVYLSMLSARHFLPDVKIYCILQYDSNKNEYDDFIKKSKLLKNIKFKFVKKKYHLGGANFSPVNGFYFPEYVNTVAKLFSRYSKVVVLDEDNYFTTGETLRWFKNTDFDLACCYWAAPNPHGFYKTRPEFEINASIFAINMKKLNKLFPIPEAEEFCELIFGHEIHDKTKKLGFDIKIIPTRNFGDYCGDGIHTNDSEVIKNHLIEVGIPLEINESNWFCNFKNYLSKLLGLTLKFFHDKK